MFRVDLDVSVVFTPPMKEDGPGFVMTRSFELPFPPFDGLSVFGKEWLSFPEPPGLVLKEVGWDIDRQTFLANSSSVHDGFPISEFVFDPSGRPAG